MKKRIFPLCALLLCAVLLSTLAGCDAHTHTFRQTVIPPTCNSMGYTVNICSCGETYYDDYQPATEHTFGDWIAEQKATLISGGEEYRICDDCGILQRREVENLSALPKLYLNGDGEGKETVSLLYAAEGAPLFTCDALLTQQADADGGKHLYELQLLAGGTAGQANFADPDWGEQDRYLLIPQTLDPTYTRTPAAQTLWNACLEQHIGEETPEWEAPALETYTHTNRSMVLQLYRDDSYMGLYLLALPLDARIGVGNSTVALRAEDESDGCLFLEKPSYAKGETDGDAQGFSFLICSDANAAWATDSFNAFAEFVRRSRDTVFRQQLSQYTDPDILLDYYLLLQFFGAPYGDTVGTVWYTTDLDHWLPTFDRFQASYGLNANGMLLNGAAGIPAPSEDGTIPYAGQNLLWGRLIKLFPAELAERYDALRQTVLQEDALYEAFLAQYGSIELGLFAEETALSPTSEAAADIQKIHEFLLTRLNAMDRWIRSLDASSSES